MTPDLALSLSTILGLVLNMLGLTIGLVTMYVKAGRRQTELHERTLDRLARIETMIVPLWTWWTSGEPMTRLVEKQTKESRHAK